MARLESKIDASSTYLGSGASGSLYEDDANTETRLHAKGESSDPDIILPTVQSNHMLESELYASRVYLRTAHRHSMACLNSRHDSVAGLSILSGISLAQISSLSVISLPVSSHELWNPRHYKGVHNAQQDLGQTIRKARVSAVGDALDFFNASGKRPMLQASIIPVGLWDGKLIRKLLSSRLKARPDPAAIRSAQIDRVLERERLQRAGRRIDLLLGEFKNNHLASLQCKWRG